ncbi:MAG: LacI family DNA-binding transcriptional regulator [Anaerolineae bacterium]|nr:LacI family DNA-binding transcriptional regulator [Anaerolineae bacterium]
METRSRRRRTNGARIEDVARMAGCSITTVSHYFSGKRPVSPTMGQQIQRAADLIGYRPDPIAQAFATGRTAVLGVQFPFQGDSLVSNPYFPAMLESVSVAAAGINCSILTIPRSFESYDIDRKALLERLDGVLLIDPWEDDPQLEKIVDYGIPIVAVGRLLRRSDVPWVDNDNESGIRQVFDHLIEQGYRRPALMTARVNYAYTYDIEATYRREIQRRGLQARIIRTSDYSERASEDDARRLLDTPDRPDAVIASTDSQAVSVLRVALELGIRVPDELAIIGEGDTVLARTAIVPISSVRINIEGLVRSAVEMMSTLLNALDADYPRLLPVTLIERASSTRHSGD